MKRTSLKEILTAGSGRADEGPSPTLEQLIDYHQGRLGDQDKERVQDYVCSRPEAAEFLLHLSHAVEMEELTDDMVAEDRQAFFRRLEEVKEEGDPSPSPPLSTYPPSESSKAQSWLLRPRNVYSIAAAVFFVSLALFLWPAAEVHEIVLDPLPAVRSGGGTLLPRQSMNSGELLLLTLALPREKAGFGYELRVYDAAEVDKESPDLSGWDASLAVASPGQGVYVKLQLESPLQPGTYWVQILEKPTADSEESQSIAFGSFLLDVAS